MRLSSVNLASVVENLGAVSPKFDRLIEIPNRLVAVAIA
jgi:hypothetical protein